MTRASRWSAFLANWDDKKKLVLFIGKKLLAAKSEIPSGKTIIASGCFKEIKTYMIQNNEARTLPELQSNHEEADTRLFAHAAWCKIAHSEISAADTDIFAIFLLNQQMFSNKEVVTIHGHGNQNRTRIIYYPSEKQLMGYSSTPWPKGWFLHVLDCIAP